MTLGLFDVKSVMKFRVEVKNNFVYNKLNFN